MKRYVQEQVITTLAMVADASEDTFAKVSFLVSLCVGGRSLRVGVVLLTLIGYLLASCGVVWVNGIGVDVVIFWWVVFQTALLEHYALAPERSQEREWTGV